MAAGVGPAGVFPGGIRLAGGDEEEERDGDAGEDGGEGHAEGGEDDDAEEAEFRAA